MQGVSDMLIHLSLSLSPSIASLSDMVIFRLASSRLIYLSICKTMHIKILQFLFGLWDLTERASSACGCKKNAQKSASQLRRDTVWCSS